MNDSIAKIAEALAGFQSEMPAVTKRKTAKVQTKQGGSYTYTYADLADVSEAALPVLTKHGLSFSCLPRATDHGYELAGRLLHTSGETLEGALPIAGNSPQEIGSALTYMRRYLFGCLTGLVTDDDDDGQLAQQAKKKPAPRKQAETRETGETITKAQLAKLHTTLNEVGITDRDAGLAFYAEVTGRRVESSKELTKAEATKVIDALVKRQEQPFAGGEPPDEEDPWAS